MSEKQTQILVGIGVPCDMLGPKQTGQFDERRDLCWPLGLVMFDEGIDGFVRVSWAASHRVFAQLDTGTHWTEVEKVVYGGGAIGPRRRFFSSVATGTRGPFRPELRSSSDHIWTIFFLLDARE